MLTEWLEWCGLLWCFYQLFGLSFWRHPFTAEHPLLRHWCNDTFLQIWWRNKLIYSLDDLRVNKSSADFLSWLNCSFQYVTCERKVTSAKAHCVLIVVLCSSECRAVRTWCRSVSALSSNTTRRFAWLLFRCTSWRSAPNKHRKSRWNTSSECSTFMSMLTIIKGVVQTTITIVWSWFFSPFFFLCVTQKN